MENIMQIVTTYVIPACSAVIAIASLIVAVIQRCKKNKVTTANGVMKELIGAIEEAEATYQNVEGVDAGKLKKEKVMNTVQLNALSKGESVNKAEVEAQLEELIDFSNKVNSNKDTVTTETKEEVKSI